MDYRAVIFDLGGVVLDSPLDAIAAYERELRIPEGFVNRLVVERGSQGAWARLERGEIPMEAFYAAFDRECADAGHAVSGEAIMRRVAEGTEPRPIMLEAIRRIRAEGIRAAALTNNWRGDRDRTRGLREHFDVFLESSALGLRKPDLRIYELACEALSSKPSGAVFLDDIGRNLKPARALGMATIKVHGPEQALEELGRLIGLKLT